MRRGPRHAAAARRGFTMVEVLVALAILGMVMGTVGIVLRAGVGMLDAMLDLVPTARVGFLGMYRDPETSKPIEYYAKLPEATANTTAFVIDPMFATAGSAIAAVDMLHARGFSKVVMICMVSCPEGIKRFEAAPPFVPIYTAAVDDHLNEHNYIVPGLGDAGDRIFGTK